MEKISWITYLIVTGGAILFYYLVIGWLYYRRELKVLIMRRPSAKAMTEDPIAETAPWEEQEGLPIPGAFDELEETVHGLGRIIREQSGTAIPGPALLALLRQHLAGYDGLHRSAFRAAINSFVIREAEEQCAIIYTETELDKAWDAL